MFRRVRTLRLLSAYLLVGLLLQVFAGAVNGAQIERALAASQSPAMFDLCRSITGGAGDADTPANGHGASAGHCMLCAVANPPPAMTVSLLFLFKQFEPRAFTPATEAPPALPSASPGDEQPPRAPPTR
jgi:hypothetical protein